MNIFDELSKLYGEIDSLYEAKEREARSKGFHRKEAEWQRKRELNDHAYFLFMFTRLEDRIREQSSKLIQRKETALKNWKIWDILPEQIHFKKRVALLTEKGASDYNLIMDYYKLRNTIAHGGNFTTQISIPHVLNDMERLYKILKGRLVSSEFLLSQTFKLRILPIRTERGRGFFAGRGSRP